MSERGRESGSQGWEEVSERREGGSEGRKEVSEGEREGVRESGKRSSK